MIDGIFAPQEAEIIKTIPLALFKFDDILFWPFSKDGKYTCKSGYHFQKEEVDLEQGDDFEIQVKKLWKGIWSLHVPNKVKNFIFYFLFFEKRWRILFGEYAKTCYLQKQIWFVEQLYLALLVKDTTTHRNKLSTLFGYVQS